MRMMRVTLCYASVGHWRAAVKVCIFYVFFTGSITNFIVNSTSFIVISGSTISMKDH